MIMMVLMQNLARPPKKPDFHWIKLSRIRRECRLLIRLGLVSNLRLWVLNTNALPTKLPNSKLLTMSQSYQSPTLPDLKPSPSIPSYDAKEISEEFDRFRETVKSENCFCELSTCLENFNRSRPVKIELKARNTRGAERGTVNGGFTPRGVSKVLEI